MKSKKILNTASGHAMQPASRERRERIGEAHNPELIEKFYKQIINSFGYAYPAKV